MNRIISDHKFNSRPTSTIDDWKFSTERDFFSLDFVSQKIGITRTGIK